MSTPGIDVALQDRLQELREEHGQTVNVEDIASVVESIMATMKGDLSADDLELYGEIEALARYIHTTKTDIAALRPDEVRDEHLPAASVELDAIVIATETATNAIMDATEKIEGLMDQIDPEAASTIVDSTTQIYEACGFQDITGQRTTKIIKALKDIEFKIDALVDAFGPEIEKYKKANPKWKDAADTLTDRDLLAGPQLEDQAQSQEEIDALLASFD